MELTTLLGIIIGILALIFIALVVIYLQLEHMAGIPDGIAHFGLDETVKEIRRDVNDMKDIVMDIHLSQ
jgi:hypothetical protein